MASSDAEVARRKEDRSLYRRPTHNRFAFADVSAPSWELRSYATEVRAHTPSSKKASRGLRSLEGSVKSCARCRACCSPHQVLSEFYPSSILSSIQFYPVPSKFYLKVYPVLSSIPRAPYTSHTANTSNISNTSNIQRTSNTSNASNTSNTSSTQPDPPEGSVCCAGTCWEQHGRPGAGSREQLGGQEPRATGSSQEQPEAGSSL